MAEQGGDGFQAHAAVDRLGCQSISELVRGDVADAGGGRGPVDGGVNAGLRDGPAVVGEHQLSGLAVAVGEPLAEQGLHSRVERDVAVGVQLADRDVEPFGVADLHDRVGGQAEEFAFAEPGAGEDLDGYPVEQGWQLAGGGEQGGGVGVVEEPGQRPVADRVVAGEDGVAHGCVVVAPLDDPVEEAAQVAEPHPDGGRSRAAAAPVAGPCGQPGFEALDVGAAESALPR